MTLIPRLSSFAVLTVAMISLFSIILCTAFGQAPLPQQSPITNLPVVTNLSIPTYPRIALLAHIQGVVKIRVTADATRVSGFDEEIGPPMLLKAAEENLRTWEFRDHHQETFTVIFEYRIEEPDQCAIGDSTAILQLPVKALITANGIMTCDPTEQITRRHHWWQFWE